jgi:hypothetical protein
MSARSTSRAEENVDPLQSGLDDRQDMELIKVWEFFNARQSGRVLAGKRK